MDDLSGARFGGLVVLGPDLSSRRSGLSAHSRWRVRCDCGNVVAIHDARLRRASIVSCGCRNGQSIDRVGQEFGALRVIALLDDGRWRLKCVCGQEIEAARIEGVTVPSCGCMTITRAKTPVTLTYQSWLAMHKRCEDPSHDAFAYYGGRGISVCARWASFAAFVADMGLRVSNDLQIDRLDNDCGYARENCRWASRTDQIRNRRSTKLVFGNVQEIIGRFEHGESKSSIARRFKVTSTYVGQLVKGDVWAEIERPYLTGCANA